MDKLPPLHEPDAQDKRTRILWLLTVVLFVSLPHLLHVNIWITLLLLGVGAWRYALEYRNWGMPSAWIKVPLVFAALAAVGFTYRSITGVEAGTALLLVMLALKILETKTGRDLTVVSAICWFLMFAAFLREQQLWAIPYILFGVSLSVAALIQISRVGAVLPSRQVITKTAGLIIQALPIMLVLFFLFPRIPAPFWAMSTGGYSAQTGLSDQMSPGDISSLSLSDSVAFRVRFNGAIPPASERYWRGPVMTYFNGREWSWADRGEPIVSVEDLLVGGTYYEYELMLEPHGREWLLALETPVQWSQGKAYLSANLQLISQTPVQQRIAYTARSYQLARKQVPDVERHIQAMRYLPTGRNPETLAFALKLRNESSSDKDYLNRVLDMFRQQDFYYTLRPPRLGNNPVDEFLFTSRRGFCEHYASAFATLARAANIPARVVTGYLGGEVNPINNDLIVRQSDAHAWAEVWIDGNWLRADPTAAVAPQRVELGLDEALSDRDFDFRRNMRNTQLFHQAILSLDAVNAAWNRWVLAFGPEMQSDLLRNAGFDKPDMRDLVLLMAISLSLLMAALTYYLRFSIRSNKDPLLQIYETFCKKLAASGVTRHRSEGPASFAARASRLRQTDRPQIELITQMYIRLRYESVGSAAPTEELRQLTELVKAFEPTSG
ncbi:MAG: DUF3488 domain-containing protein [Chromatiales bacterium]|nr:DUF3488 domain-containing protein [Chromatiales bacterium]